MTRRPVVKRLRRTRARVEDDDDEAMEDKPKEESKPARLRG